jgi:hypothetical protein
MKLFRHWPNWPEGFLSGLHFLGECGHFLHVFGAISGLEFVHNELCTEGIFGRGFWQLSSAEST